MQNVVERAVILIEGETFFVDEAWLTRVPPKLTAKSVPLVADLVEHEREMLEAALRESEGSNRGVQPALPLSWAFLARPWNQK